MTGVSAGHGELIHAGGTTRRVARPATALQRARPRVSLALVGCGGVGRALLSLLNRGGFAFNWKLVALANSRCMHLDAGGMDSRRAAELLGQATLPSDVGQLAAFLEARADGVPVILDATPSAEVASRHVEWLARGVHVVTANKLAAVSGEPYRAGHGGAYGDAATVGAGLPVLSALRRLRAAGDRIHRIEGSLSGSLAYLFHALQSGQCFSKALGEAYQAGYTEPDPCQDLSGRDVARKMAIVARTAGLGELTGLRPEGLLPDEVGALTGQSFWRALPGLDADWRRRVREAHDSGRVLRYLASIGIGDEPRIGTVAVPREDPRAATSGADNLVAIYSEAYHPEPLVIRGPGAGAGRTALAMLGDVAALTSRY